MAAPEIYGRSVSGERAQVGICAPLDPRFLSLYGPAHLFLHLDVSNLQNQDLLLITGFDPLLYFLIVTPLAKLEK